MLQEAPRPPQDESKLPLPWPGQLIWTAFLDGLAGLRETSRLLEPVGGSPRAWTEKPSWPRSRAN
eukprot:5657915-Pyramimonas_sp.AAC.1